MKVVFDDKAISDLQAIREWIEQDSPAMADKLSIAYCQPRGV